MRDINPDDRIVQRLLVTLLSLVAVPTLQRQPLGRAVLCVPLAAEPVGFSAAHEQRSVSQAQRSRQAGALAHPMLGSSGRLDSRMVTTAATSAATQSCRLSTTSASGTAAAMPALQPGQRSAAQRRGARAHRRRTPGRGTP